MTFPEFLRSRATRLDRLHCRLLGHRLWPLPTRTRTFCWRCGREDVRALSEHQWNALVGALYALASVPAAWGLFERGEPMGAFGWVLFGLAEAGIACNAMAQHYREQARHLQALAQGVSHG